MPPKKKGGGKGGASAIIDGVDTTQMSREQLEVFCHRIKEQNEREREERNFFQLERDKLRTFWEISKNELEEARAKLRNKDRQIEEAAEKNDEELKFYKQKVKHLQYEHQNSLTESKAEALVSLKMAQDDHTEQERQLLKDKRDLKSTIREQEVSHQDQMNSMKMLQSEEISQIREKYEMKEKELETKYEKKFADLKHDMTTSHSMEMAELEERKNTQVTELTKNHEKAFNEMKNYYNDITLNNLALISSLKDQMEVLRNQNERMSKQVADISAENRKLALPLKQALVEVAEYKRQLQNYEKDKISLMHTKNKLATTKKELDDLRWANDALELRFEKLTAEKDELSKRFVQAILEVQQKTSFKNILLQKRVEKLNNLVEIREVALSELGSKCGKHVRMPSLENTLQKKNVIIMEMQYELARICKAHDDLLATYEDKLQQYGIPKEELGFVPMRALPQDQAGLPKQPAGLVTQNR